MSGLILDDYYLATPPAQAVRNCPVYLIEQLQRLVRHFANQGIDPIPILNLSSGAARELCVLAGDPVFARKAWGTCVDLDPGALQLAHQRLDGRLDGQMSYVCTNFLHVARQENLGAPFAIIYVAGLFDYLKDHRAACLIEVVTSFSLMVGSDRRQLFPTDVTQRPYPHRVVVGLAPAVSNRRGLPQDLCQHAIRCRCHPDRE